MCVQVPIPADVPVPDVPVPDVSVLEQPGDIHTKDLPMPGEDSFIICMVY